jgi:tetratricopeptide (TPR) repeat protein
LSAETTEAIESSRQANRLAEPLARANTTVTWFQTELSQSKYNEGYFLSSVGDYAKANAALEEALAGFRRLADSDPDVPESQIDVANVTIDLGTLEIHLNHVEKGRTLGMQALRRLEAISEPSALAVYAKARAHALVGDALAKSRGRATLDGEGTPRDHSAAAVELIRRAHGAGYRHLAYMATDWALEPLRSRSDFPKLMMEMGSPSGHFAHHAVIHE